MARALKLSSGLKNYIMGTGSLLSALNGGGTSKCAIQLYASSATSTKNVPASPDDAANGTLLGTIKNGASFITWEADTTNKTVKKVSSETWSCIIDTAVGLELDYFRIVMDTDDIGTDAATATEKRIQGLIDGDGNSDMYMQNPTVNTSDVKTLATFVLSVLDA